MMKVGILDVKILALGVRNRNRVDEQVLEGSGVGSAGTGRILDNLASMIERGLLKLNEDKSFQVTDLARQILWGDGIPVRVKILRILEISSLGADKIAEYLDEDDKKIGSEIEGLRRNRLVLMSALRTGRGIEQVFEITSEGRRVIGKAGADLPDDSEVFELLEDIAGTIKNSKLDENVKSEILGKVSRVQARLDI